MYKVLKTEGRAKRAVMETVHGTIQTPVFMNVGTVAAIKGAVSTDDLHDIGTQVQLSNTYHLHVRTGDKTIKELGGLHSLWYGSSDPYRFRRISGVLPQRAAQDQGRRCVLPVTY